MIIRKYKVLLIIIMPLILFSENCFLSSTKVQLAKLPDQLPKYSEPSYIINYNVKLSIPDDWDFIYINNNPVRYLPSKTPTLIAEYSNINFILQGKLVVLADSKPNQPLGSWASDYLSSKGIGNLQWIYKYKDSSGWEGFTAKFLYDTRSQLSYQKTNLDPELEQEKKIYEEIKYGRVLQQKADTEVDTYEYIYISVFRTNGRYYELISSLIDQEKNSKLYDRDLLWIFKNFKLSDTNGIFLSKYGLSIDVPIDWDFRGSINHEIGSFRYDPNNILVSFSYVGKDIDALKTSDLEGYVKSKLEINLTTVSDVVTNFLKKEELEGTFNPNATSSLEGSNSNYSGTNSYTTGSSSYPNSRNDQYNTKSYPYSSNTQSQYEQSNTYYKKTPPGSSFSYDIQNIMQDILISKADKNSSETKTDTTSETDDKNTSTGSKKKKLNASSKKGKKKKDAAKKNKKSGKASKDTSDSDDESEDEEDDTKSTTTKLEIEISEEKYKINDQLSALEFNITGLKDIYKNNITITYYYIYEKSKLFEVSMYFNNKDSKDIDDSKNLFDTNKEIVLSFIRKIQLEGK